MNKGSGKFFHIDFGHFLDHCKSKMGVKRDREPFIFSKELRFLMVGFERIYKDFKPDDQNDKPSIMSQYVPPKKFLNQANGLNNDGSMPDNDAVTRSATTHDDIAPPNEGLLQKRVNRVSQRKLYRVKKWKGVKQADRKEK